MGVRCVVGGPVTKSHYCNWKLKSHLFSPLVLTVTTKTGALLQKLTFGIGVKGQPKELPLKQQRQDSLFTVHKIFLSTDIGVVVFSTAPGLAVSSKQLGL